MKSNTVSSNSDRLLEKLPLDLLSNPHIAVSYSIIPESVAEKRSEHLWVQAVAAAIGSAMEMAEKNKFGKWQETVTDTLDEIVLKLNEILQELRDLKVWFDERITEETRRQYHQKITSIGTDVNRIIVSLRKPGGGDSNKPPSSDQLADLKAHFRDLRVTIDSLSMTDGYSHVMGVAAGVIVAIPLFTLLKRTSERSDWARRLASYFASAVDPANSKSVESARNQAATEYSAAKQAFEARLNVRWMTNYDLGSGDNLDPIIVTRPPGRPSIPPTFWIQQAGGSLENGTNLKGRERGQGYSFPGWYPNLREHYDMGDGPDKSWDDMYRHLEGIRQDVVSKGVKAASLAEKVAELAAIQSKLVSVSNLIEIEDEVPTVE